MRGVLLLVLGCSVACSNDGFGSLPGGALAGPDGNAIECQDDDAACPSGGVCARNDFCYSADSVRSGGVSWTLQGQAANATTCGPAPNLTIEFLDSTSPGFDYYGQVSFAPVPCVEGKFSIDKLPTLLDEVVLGIGGAGSRAGTLDTNGQLTLDLPF